MFLMYVCLPIFVIVEDFLNFTEKLLTCIIVIVFIAALTGF